MRIFLSKIYELNVLEDIKIFFLGLGLGLGLGSDQFGLTEI